jgi:IclR family transcriptional regulator, KDG regulon repressor
MQETAPITQQPTASGAPTPDPFQPQYRIQALERAAAILGAFTAEEPELRLSDLAERLGLHKATTHRFLVNLEHLGFVERAPRSGKYRLGWRLFELGGLVSQRLDLWDEALPFLEGLVRDTGETGHLAVLEGGQVVYIERVETRRALRLPAAARRGHPAHATNLGKVLLAYASPEVVDEILLAGELPAFTPNTITNLDQLRIELVSIKERGYSVDNEEYDEGLRCIGAPVRDSSGRVVAAIGIGGPVTRITPARIEDLARVVIAAAHGLSLRLGAGHAPAWASSDAHSRNPSQFASRNPVPSR